MKIVVTGTRGIPDIQGGVETHCEELFPRIAALGHDVTVIRRSCYVTPANRRKEFRGVRLTDVFAPRLKSMEAILHTFLAVLKARTMNPDILHIHAIGPSLMVPFARLLGMKVVMTHHGFDYNRGKWGGLAKTILRTGERWGVRKSSAVIVISREIADHCADSCGRRDTALIYNGVTPPAPTENTDYIESLGLTPRRYIVAVGRFVPEKCFDLLIEAFADSGLAEKGFRLAIAGDADHPDTFSNNLKKLAASHADKVVMTGFIRGEKLNQLFSNAALFCLPSTHEGLPISLLEAMSHRLDILVSDIPANLIAEIDHRHDTFPCGDKKALTEALRRKLTPKSATPRDYDLSAYNWDHIAHQTLRLYSSLL